MFCRCCFDRKFCNGSDSMVQCHFPHALDRYLNGWHELTRKQLILVRFILVRCVLNFWLFILTLCSLKFYKNEDKFDLLYYSSGTHTIAHRLV